MAGSNNNTVLPTTSTITSLRAAKSGKVVKVEAATVAKLAQALGAGRSHPKDRSPAEISLSLTVSASECSTLIGPGPSRLCSDWFKLWC